jgi:hypothetical protein
LAAFLSAFKPENLKKIEKNDKDDRIGKEIDRFKRFFLYIFYLFWNNCCICCHGCCNSLKIKAKVFIRAGKKKNADDDDIASNVSSTSIGTGGGTLPNEFLEKEYAKQVAETRRRKKILKQKEQMKRIQEKNTIEKEKNILMRCFPSFIYRM